MILKLLENKEVVQFKQDMKEAFRIGALEGTGIDEEVLPDEDIDRSLKKEESFAYVVMENKQILGGAIVEINQETNVNHLDFLYVKAGFQGKKIGQFLWQEIEKRYPETKIWETCTPYFDKRNIHFYINKCGFHAVEFFNKYHADPSFPNDYEDDYWEGMFRFEKFFDIFYHYYSSNNK